MRFRNLLIVSVVAGLLFSSGTGVLSAKEIDNDGNIKDDAGYHWMPSGKLTTATLDLLENLRENAENLSKDFGKGNYAGWTKAVLKRPNENDAGWSDTYVNAFAKKDAFFHFIKNNNDSDTSDAGSPDYFDISDPALAKKLTGFDVIGLTRDELFEKFGIPEEDLLSDNSAIYTLNSVETDGGMSVTFNLNNNKVDSISDHMEQYYDGGLPYFQAFEKYASEVSIPEHWLTEGISTGDNVNIREKPVDGKVLGQTMKKDMLFISEFKEINGKGSWAKIITLKGIEGWMSAQYVGPSIKSYDAGSRMIANFNFFCNSKLSLGAPITSEEEPDADNWVFRTTKWKDAELIEGWQKEEGNGGMEYTNHYVHSMMVYTPKLNLAGLRVGDGVEELKKFENDIAIADWTRDSKDAFEADGIYVFHDNSDYRNAKITMTKGKISCIEVFEKRTYNLNNE